jgi:Major Facilitator Superfamily
MGKTGSSTEGEIRRIVSSCHFSATVASAALSCEQRLNSGRHMSMHPRHVMAKVARHLIAFLIFCYLLSYLDRVNIGFATLTMNKDLGLSASAFGFGASIFFLGYFLFEVPSNLLLERYGARIWIARIMISWGVLSTAMAFVGNDTSFYVLRFIFGIAEAGFSWHHSLPHLLVSDRNASADPPFRCNQRAQMAYGAT